MSQLNTLSKLTNAAVALGIFFTTGVAQAATLGSTGQISISDPSSYSFDYLGSSSLPGTRLSTGTGSQYKFSTNLSGNYAGTSISGTVSIGEIDFAPTGGAQVNIINDLKRAKLFKLSNFTMTNSSNQALDYTTGQNARLFTFTNNFASFSLSQFYTVINGQVGQIANGNLTCDQIQNQNFNISMTGQGGNVSNGSNFINSQRPMYADQTMVDSNCNFQAQVDTRVINGGQPGNYVNSGNYNNVLGFINSLVLPAGYTFKMTNSFNMFQTDSNVSLNDQDVENLVNVAIGKPIDNPDNFNFKVFAVDPDTGNRGKEIYTKQVPEPSTLFGLVAFGGLLISGIKKSNKIQQIADK